MAKEPMSTDYVKRKPKRFFENKKAILLTTYSNMDNQEILENTEIIIIGKNSRTNQWLDIKDPKTNLELHGILPFHLKLV